MMHSLIKQYRVPAIRVDEHELDPEAIKLVSRDICERLRLIPVGRSGSSLIVAMTDPTSLDAIDAIRSLSGCRVEPMVASEEAIQAAIERYYDTGRSSASG